jgi:hypothetical protein
MLPVATAKLPCERCGVETRCRPTPVNNGDGTRQTAKLCSAHRKEQIAANGTATGATRPKTTGEQLRKAIQEWNGAKSGEPARLVWLRVERLIAELEIAATGRRGRER